MASLLRFALAAVAWALAGPLVAQDCLPNQLLCNGVCIDPQSSSAHCGACGAACYADEDCIAGTCALRDNDGDGWSNPEESSGIGACNPNDARFNPGVRERCNTIDDNCNGASDEGDAAEGLCPAQVNSLCTRRACGGGSCATVNEPPGTACGTAGAVCNAQGQCVLTPESVAFARDLDADGFVPPMDCNDDFAGVRPGLAEVCDARDNDCDAEIDEGVSCDDGNACTTDSCRGTPGCRNRPRADGTPCGAGSICLAVACVTIDVFGNGFEP